MFGARCWSCSSIGRLAILWKSWWTKSQQQKWRSRVISHLTYCAKNEQVAPSKVDAGGLLFVGGGRHHPRYGLAFSASTRPLLRPTVRCSCAAVAGGLAFSAPTRPLQRSTVPCSCDTAADGLAFSATMAPFATDGTAPCAAAAAGLAFSASTRPRVRPTVDASFVVKGCGYTQGQTLSGAWAPPCASMRPH